MANIHPQAMVESGAEIGENVTVEPFAVVKSGVTLEDSVIVKSHAYLDGTTRIGEGTIIYPGVSIGTKTQDLKYQGERTSVSIGKACEIREFATINSSCGEDTVVVVGDNTIIMAYCHVAHNCEVGNNVVMANGVNLAGFVKVEPYATIGGMTPVHQRVRIGAYAMVGGGSRILRDIPPYTIGGGLPEYKFGGINLVGLKRHQFSLSVRRSLARSFQLVYRSGLLLKEALQQIEESVEMFPEVEHFLEFCRGALNGESARGLMGLQGITVRSKKRLEGTSHESVAFFEEPCELSSSLFSS